MGTKIVIKELTIINLWLKRIDCELSLISKTRTEIGIFFVKNLTQNQIPSSIYAWNWNKDSSNLF